LRDRTSLWNIRLRPKCTAIKKELDTEELIREIKDKSSHPTGSFRYPE
jgi:hypothetical protein